MRHGRIRRLAPYHIAPIRLSCPTCCWANILEKKWSQRFRHNEIKCLLPLTKEKNVLLFFTSFSPPCKDDTGHTVKNRFVSYRVGHQYVCLSKLKINGGIEPDTASKRVEVSYPPITVET